MKVCFIVSQIFAWGKYGGFGSLTRLLGRGLADKGVEVSAVVPMRAGQRRRERLDDIDIFGYNQALFLFDKEPFRACGADIFHSQEPTFSSYLAIKAMPDSRHIITCQDPRDRGDLYTEFIYSSPEKRIRFPATWFFESSAFSSKAVREADAVYCQAKFIKEKAKRLYGLRRPPGFLPNPVVIPKEKPNKARRPTVCFMGRWDRRKRPELFFELAKHRPDIHFIAVGSDHDKKRDARLRRRYSSLPNLEMPGFIDQFSSPEADDALKRSWVLVNTSARECLPVTFLEAAANRCAILSGVEPDPDGFAGSFGYHARGGDFERGLDYLIEGDRWKGLGEKGFEYVLRNHAMDKVVDEHIKAYHEILSDNSHE